MSAGDQPVVPTDGLQPSDLARLAPIAGWYAPQPLGDHADLDMSRVTTPADRTASAVALTRGGLVASGAHELVTTDSGGDMRQILSENAIRDMQTEMDSAFLRAVNLVQRTPEEEERREQTMQEWHSQHARIAREDYWHALMGTDSSTPSTSLETSTEQLRNTYDALDRAVATDRPVSEVDEEQREQAREELHRMQPLSNSTSYMGTSWLRSTSITLPVSAAMVLGMLSEDSVRDDRDDWLRVFQELGQLLAQTETAEEDRQLRRIRIKE